MGEAGERESGLDRALAAGRTDSDPAGAVRAEGLYLSLEHAGDPDFQQREWRVQRAGSALLAGWIAAAALGFSGPGPCSARERHSPDAALAFEAVVHQDAPTRWRIRSASGIERLVLEGAQAMELQELRPSASREARADGARVFRFRGAAPKHVEIEVVPRGAGWSRGRLQLAGGEELAFEQLVLP